MCIPHYPKTARQTHVIKVSTELVGNDGADIRQNLSFILQGEYV
jgi:hypothetical protein